MAVNAFDVGVLSFKHVFGVPVMVELKVLALPPAKIMACPAFLSKGLLMRVFMAV